MNSERMKGAELIFLLDLLYVQRGEKEERSRGWASNRQSYFHFVSFILLVVVLCVWLHHATCFFFPN